MPFLSAVSSQDDLVGLHLFCSWAFVGEAGGVLSLRTWKLAGRPVNPSEVVLDLPRRVRTAAKSPGPAASGVSSSGAGAWATVESPAALLAVYEDLTDDELLRASPPFPGSGLLHLLLIEPSLLSMALWTNPPNPLVGLGVRSRSGEMRPWLGLMGGGRAKPSVGSGSTLPDGLLVRDGLLWWLLVKTGAVGGKTLSDWREPLLETLAVDRASGAG